MPEVLTGESLDLQTLLADPTTVIVARLSKHAIDLEGEPLQLSDIVECDFAGYAPVQLTDFTVPQSEDENFAEAISWPIEFVAGALVAAQEAHALYLTISLGAAEPVIWRVFPFVPSFTFDVPNRTLRKQVRISAFDDTTPPPDDA